jgi:hypothetical protein
VSALANATPAQFAQINALIAQSQAFGGSAGNVVAGGLFGSAIASDANAVKKAGNQVVLDDKSTAALAAAVATAVKSELAGTGVNVSVDETGFGKLVSRRDPEQQHRAQARDSVPLTATRRESMSRPESDAMLTALALMEACARSSAGAEIEADVAALAGDLTDMERIGTLLAAQATLASQLAKFLYAAVPNSHDATIDDMRQRALRGAL